MTPPLAWCRAPVALLLALPLLAGCVSQRAYETEPVLVDSPQGPVLCQLYTDRIVMWDRAIQRPATMTEGEADAVCLAEGQRRANPA